MSCAARSWRFQQPASGKTGTPRPRSRILCTAAISRGSGNADGGGKGVGSLAVSPGLALDPQTHFLTALCSPEAAAAACVVRYLDALARAGQPGSPAAQRWGGGGSGSAALTEFGLHALSASWRSHKHSGVRAQKHHTA
jgi:hypothetical protein